MYGSGGEQRCFGMRRSLGGDGISVTLRVRRVWVWMKGEKMLGFHESSCIPALRLEFLSITVV